jgi:hypothetical protein
VAGLLAMGAILFSISGFYAYRGISSYGWEKEHANVLNTGMQFFVFLFTLKQTCRLTFSFANMIFFGICSIWLIKKCPDYQNPISKREVGVLFSIIHLN